jgi:hypothetical protein
MNTGTIKLENKIKELRDIISEYESNELLTFLAGILLQMPGRHENPFLKKLMSPLRQLFFLGFLNLTSTKQKTKKGFSEEEWNKIADLLHGIEMEYFYLLGFPKQGKETAEELQKIKVTMPTFMNHFFNGPLAYQEQEIERIEEIFKDFQLQIQNEFGVSISDFITFYDLINDQIQKNLNLAFKLVNKEAWEAFTDKCVAKGLNDPKDWIAEAPDEIYAYVNFMKNPGSILIIDLSKLDYSILSRGKCEKIIELFTCNPKPTADIIYYTQENELLSKPFIRISDSEFLPFLFKQYLNACYTLLFDACLKINKDKLLKARDNFVERKTVAIFNKIFQKEGFIYTNYSIDNGVSEQDLLILYKGNALIIEIKAAGYRAPMRDPHKAFDKLKMDFKKSIQYAYEQTLRVSKAFKNLEKLPIMDARKKVLYEIPTKKYKTYPIIVTLERMGQIQIDLEDMLEIDENELYPWCVSIDDLEAFILTLSKTNNKIQSLLTFLEYREKYHGHLLCSDELEICGAFLKNKKDFIARSEQEEIVVTYPDLTEPIEKSYREGMGFDNERHFQSKKDGRVHFLYEDSKKNKS